MIGFMITVGVAMACVASYGFGWYYRGRYEAPYIKQMRDALNVASGVFDATADAEDAGKMPWVRNRAMGNAMHDATLRPWH